ncbi:hypothetical protein BCR35DRAFT_298320 [Leucosporidium creatinivorum]|uniref:Uncharacterized protein n=1 Tax=Leucosporidium creatinivorum TaxID=106004 RepID=A0A1Y2G4B7_9BASI|nr:hypothetical protein BCR35DRAFT_298320 [Leucosporidium creatinivorum]
MTLARGRGGGAGFLVVSPSPPPSSPSLRLRSPSPAPSLPSNATQQDPTTTSLPSSSSLTAPPPRVKQDLSSSSSTTTARSRLSTLPSVSPPTRHQELFLLSSVLAKRPLATFLLRPDASLETASIPRTLDQTSSSVVMDPSCTSLELRFAATLGRELVARS